MARVKAQPESLIKASIFQYLACCPEFMGWVETTTGIYDPTRKIFRKRTGTGMRRGVSDIVGGWRGQLLCIEVKSKYGVVSPEQKKFGEDVVANGGLFFVARSVSEVVDFIAALRFVGVSEKIKAGIKPNSSIPAS